LSGRLVKALFQQRVLIGAEHRHLLDATLATVIDIGANRGQFSLAARRWAPGARVFAFEPLSVPAEVFRKVFAGDARVRLYQAAIGPQAGEAVIHVSAADDSSSLLPISGLQGRIFPGTGEAATEKIRVGRLSDFVSAEDIKAPAMLKLDVQGFELEALRGCEVLLGRFSLVYVECSFIPLYTGQALADEVIAWLREKLPACRRLPHELRYKGSCRAGRFLFYNDSSQSRNGKGEDRENSGCVILQWFYS